MASFKKVLTYLLPHGIIMYRYKKKLQQKNNERKKKLNQFDEHLSEEKENNIDFDYEESIQFLVNYGLSESQIRSGSIAETDLHFVIEELKKHVSSDNPLRVLHIGNFVGISLTYLVNYLRKSNEDSLILSIDPNIEHRGVSDPERFVKRLLSRYGLDENVILLDGFSLEKNLKNDAGIFYESGSKIIIEDGCSFVLANLTKLLNPVIDVCIIDGNHEYGYLKEEISYCSKLMKPAGVLVLDDVDDNWPDVNQIFKELIADNLFTLLASNKRIAIMQLNK